MLMFRSLVVWISCNSLVKYLLVLLMSTIKIGFISLVNWLVVVAKSYTITFTYKYPYLTEFQQQFPCYQLIWAVLQCSQLSEVNNTENHFPRSQQSSDFMLNLSLLHIDLPTFFQPRLILICKLDHNRTLYVWNIQRKLSDNQSIKYNEYF